MAYEENPWGGSTETGGRTPKRLGGAAPTMSDRVGETLGKTKDVASAGFGKTKAVASVAAGKSKVAAGKIKVGASVGFNWIRRKYKTSKLFQKK